jgi:predicted N-formylglutamate amidohydrolase
MVAAELAEGYRVVSGRADAGIVILCDHASNALPAEYGTLGLPAAEFERHIAYDIGAAAVAEHLARALEAPALFTRVSRLLIDPNRGTDDPTLIMRLSDGAIIPDNRELTALERARRIARFYQPYHDAVARVIAACRATGRVPVIFSVHSMTPVWKGVARPWDVSVLWHKDFGLAEKLLAGLRANSRLVVGDNVPYFGGLDGNTLSQQAHPFGLPNVVIEYRQDLVADARGQAHWAERTAAILRGILAQDEMQRRTLATPQAQESRIMAKTDAKTETTAIDAATQTELEAAAFRKLVAHLQARTDVQNIDMMTLAGFCRNCLANWFQEAAASKGLSVDKTAARTHIYGMPHAEWQAKYQKEATPQQTAALAAAKPPGH